MVTSQRGGSPGRESRRHVVHGLEVEVARADGAEAFAAHVAQGAAAVHRAVVAESAPAPVAFVADLAGEGRRGSRERVPVHWPHQARRVKNGTPPTHAHSRVGACQHQSRV